MYEKLMRVGDEVIITIPKENRDWGYNPCPDGTRATIIGFSEIHYGRLGNFGLKPGIYVNRYWVILRLKNGTEHTEFSERLSPVDKAEYERRLKEFQAKRAIAKNDDRDEEFISDLPETPFWEGDFVRVHGRSRVTSVYSEMPPERDPDVFQIIGIDYHFLDKKTECGTKYPAYKISDKISSGWNTAASEDDMELVERGPVWKFYHNEPISFSDIKEEATFHDRIGQTESIRNPKNGLYSWTKEEALEAIKKGLAHGFSMSGSIFGSSPHISVQRFRDENVGMRVAQATLKCFGLAQA
ncbi:MAG: hypothetical protein A2Y82_05550 [Candidatus Buchananbacteria bacterium RBG_13_36_9]|uniref:Uncharacterized protein n=1 Tax=Candidatus Buchananbacteria bacterium RBG_13_36_9 TaxID=1797530 RepID=A0A1G1XPA8_9BACT|nr:MAG: hypothetical protein A2Y82_05550 [Candidatus Buchananbacteria bacterium RBG_13_36_9]